MNCYFPLTCCPAGGPYSKTTSARATLKCSSVKMSRKFASESPLHTASLQARKFIHNLVLVVDRGGCRVGKEYIEHLIQAMCDI